MIPPRKFCSFQARDIDRTAGYSVPINAEPFDVCAALTAEHEFSDLTHTVEVPHLRVLPVELRRCRPSTTFARLSHRRSKPPVTGAHSAS
jgi:hypothetical protein